MAESMRGDEEKPQVHGGDQGGYRTDRHRHGLGAERRNLGNLIFIDLRDRSGLLQIVFDSADVGDAGMEKAASLRSEYVIAVSGIVAKRGGAVNENLATGELEIQAKELRILSEAQTPPFPIEENIQTRDELRLKYRYLDLRRPNLQRNLMLRSHVATEVRKFMAQEGFLEIETPVLVKSTPEGARDYLVPSRIHRAASTPCPSRPSCLSSCSCARATTGISRSRNVSGMRICGRTASRNLPRLIWSCPLWTSTM